MKTNSYIFTFKLYIYTILLLFTFVFPYTIVAQTQNNSNESVSQNALLSFSIDQTPIHVGDTFTLHLTIENVTDLAGWQCDIEFDPNVLEVDEVLEGDFLKDGTGKTLFLDNEIDNTAGEITDLGSARTTKGGVSGTGKLLSVAFVAKAIGEALVILDNLKASSSNFLPTGKLDPIQLSIIEIDITVEEEPVVSNPVFSFSTDVSSVFVGDTFTLHLNAEDLTDFARWQCDLVFDPNVLEAVEVTHSDLLKEGGATPSFENGTIDNMIGNITQISSARLSGGVTGEGRLMSVTFIAKAKGDANITLADLQVGNSGLDTIPLDPPQIAITVEEVPIFSFSTDVTSVIVGDTFTLHLNAENVTDLLRWQCDLEFDPSLLEAVEVTHSDLLKEGGATPSFENGTIDNMIGNITQISAARLSGGVTGEGRLMSVTFIAKANGEANITLADLQAGISDLDTIPLDPPQIAITVEEVPIFSFSTDVSSVIVGDTFTLHLNAENVTDLLRWQCDIVFDPNVLEVVEVVEGDFLKEGNQTTIFLPNRIDNSAGEITGLGTVRLNPDGVRGTGRLLSVEFAAKTTGQAQTTISNLYAYSSDSVAIPLSIPEIVITVSDVNSTILSFLIDELPVRVDDTFTLHLNVEDTTDLAGWLCDIVFDPAVLEVVEVSEGDFLKKDDGTTLFLDNIIDNTAGKITSLGAISLGGDGVSGEGRLLSVTFMAKVFGETQVNLTNLHAGSIDLIAIPLSIPEFVITVEERVFLPWDVNKDGQVSILDLMHVAQYLTEDASVSPESDVDNDGTIGILDLIAVAQHLDESTVSAPGMIANRSINFASVVVDSEKLMPAMIRTWITHAQIEDDGSLVFRKGIMNLQTLLTSLTPKRTALLANYPNPFNPETWIPYHLAKPAEVTLIIYTTDGNIVRTLVLGYQDVGIYKSRSRAAYWDGKNSMGESVASGIYFYTLIAGNFTATRKMLIRK